MSNSTYLSVTDLARGIENGSMSPVGAVERCLERISSLDGQLGAFQVVYEDEAMAGAEAAARACASGHRIGPFHGVPFALKDIVDVEGRITTGGSKTMLDRVSPATAIIARRLLAAGGILIGKTKTVEVAMGGWGTNTHMGTPQNPWDLETVRTPGGSSSGSGVSVATGMAGCAVGTDTGGSVRLPAGWCGIVGLKTTEGLLPTDGIMPLSHTLDTPGPMARSVADTVLMFEVMLGRHPLDTERDMNAGNGLFGRLNQGVNGLRLGVLNSTERAVVDNEILSLYDAACEELRSLGAELVTFTGPMDFADLTTATATIIGSEGYFHHGALFEAEDLPIDPDVRPRILLGQSKSARDYIEALMQRRQDQADFLKSLRGIDALLTPTVPTPAVALDEVDQSSTPAHFTRAGNYLGLCGLSVPMGLTSGRLPGGLQVLARGLDESMAVRVGAAYEGRRGAFPHPIP